MPKEIYQKLPPDFEKTIQIIGDVVIRHDLISFELLVQSDWHDLGIAKPPTFSALFTRDTSNFIQTPDEEISVSMPPFPAELNRSEAFKKLNFFPHITESLMALRDSAGYFYSLTGGGSEKDALLYLERLEKRELLLKPLCDYFDAKLDVNGENEAPSGKVNGLEFVILYNLLGNAYHHSSGRLKVADKEYASVVDFDLVSREFIVTSRSDSDVNEKFDFDIITLAHHGHFGLFISAVYAFHSGKQLHVSNELNNLFVCKVQKP